MCFGNTLLYPALRRSVRVILLVYHRRLERIKKLRKLFAESEGGDSCLVRFEVFCFEILEKLLAAAYHLDQAATSHMVVLVDLEVLGDLFDTSRENRSLRLRRPDVVLVGLCQLDRLCFVVCCNHQ